MPPRMLSVRTIGSFSPIFSGVSTRGGFVNPLPISQYPVAPIPANNGL